jgi:hypothetical protein
MALYSRGGLGNAKIAFRLRNGPDAVANEVTTLRGIQNLGMAESKSTALPLGYAPASPN